MRGDTLKYQIEVSGNLCKIVRQKKDGKRKYLCRTGEDAHFVWAQESGYCQPVVFTQDAAEAVVWALNEA